MEKVLFLFMIFSTIGWLWETPWVSFRMKKYVNRGFLHGPYIPIYGCAIVTVILSMGIFDGINNSSIFLMLIQVVYIGLVTAVWEFLTSWTLEKIFHTRWWDYSDHKFNFQGRVSLHVTVFFAISAFVIWRFVNPVFVELYDAIPEKTMFALLIGFYIVFSIDSYLTLRDLFKLRDIIITLEKLSTEITGKIGVSVADFKDGLQLRKDYLKGNLSEVKLQIQELLKKLPSGPSFKSVKTELEKVSDTLKNRSSIYRFMAKYPHSASSKLSTFKLTIKNMAINKDKIK
jgi:uncharacterized membrane protein